MSTLAISNSKAVSREQKSWKERIKAYFEENGAYFAAAMTAMNGSYYAAAQLASDARR